MTEGALSGITHEPVATGAPIAPPAPTSRVHGRRWRRARPGWVLLWLAFAVAIVLGAVAPIRRTGDAHQYYAMAFALSHLRPPALTPAEMTSFKGWRDRQPDDSHFPGGGLLDQPALVADGRQEFSHFWFYPLLAAPLVGGAESLGFHPGRGFLVINVLLLAFGLWRSGRAFGPAATLLLLASPVLWWVDKAQVELFEFALLAVAMAEARRGRFLWASVAAAAAATQNAPIIALVIALWGAAAVRWLGRGGFGRLRRDGSRAPRPGWRTATLIAAAALLGAAHPIYYLVQVGVLTPQRLNGGFRAGWPALRSYVAPLWDPDIGLLWWAPLPVLLAIIGLVGLIRSGWRGPWVRRLSDLRLTAACAVAAGTVFLFSFTQTPNINSGGTYHLLRYDVWLLPLLLPFIEPALRLLRQRQRWLPLARGVVTFAVYAIWFRPMQPETYLAQAPQSAWLLRWLPGVYSGPIAALRPVPEIFYERRTGREALSLGDDPGSAASKDCRVILLSRSSPLSSCGISDDEWTRANALFGQGWRSAWIVRQGKLGVGGSAVRGGVRGAWHGTTWRNPAAQSPSWQSWLDRGLTPCVENRCAPQASLDKVRSVRNGIEYTGWIAAPGGPPSAVYLIFGDGVTIPMSLGTARADVTAAIDRPDLSDAVVMRAVVPLDTMPWQSGAVCPTSLRLVDSTGTSVVQVAFASMECGIVPPPAAASSG